MECTCVGEQSYVTNQKGYLKLTTSCGSIQIALKNGWLKHDGLSQILLTVASSLENNQHSDKCS